MSSVWCLYRRQTVLLYSVRCHVPAPRSTVRVSKHHTHMHIGGEIDILMEYLTHAANPGSAEYT